MSSAFPTAHQRLAAGGSGGRGGETSDRRDLFQPEGGATERRVLEEEQEFTAASAARREDAVRFGPVGAVEGALLSDEYRGARGGNIEKLHEGARGVAQRRLR